MCALCTHKTPASGSEWRDGETLTAQASVCRPAAAPPPLSHTGLQSCSSFSQDTHPPHTHPEMLASTRGNPLLQHVVPLYGRCGVNQSHGHTTSHFQLDTMSSALTSEINSGVCGGAYNCFSTQGQVVC